MTRSIHSLAVVDPRAEIGSDVQIGPFSVIGPDVTIGDGCRIENNVTLQGNVHLGEGNHLYPNVVMGGPPQDWNCKGEGARVEIGDNNVFREAFTVHRGSEKEDSLTTIGSGCYFMNNTHVAHDCKVGDKVMMANGSMLAGHVHVHSFAIISGLVGVHHFCTVGSYAFVGGMSRVIQDVPPFMLTEGVPAKPRCINFVGLKRNQFSRDQMKALSDAHRLLYRDKVGLDSARETLRDNGTLVPVVNHLLSFVESQHEGRNGRGRESIRMAA